MPADERSGKGTSYPQSTKGTRRPSGCCNPGSVEDRPDVLLFFCPPSRRVLESLRSARYTISVGSSYLAAFLEDRGFKTTFHFGSFDNDPGFESILEAVSLARPGVAGFTVYDANVPVTLRLCRTLKRQYPELAIVWGGPTLRYESRAIVERYGDAVDVCVVGEGEMPMSRLLSLDRPWRSRALRAIEGITYRDPRSRSIVENPPGATLSDRERDAGGRRGDLDIYPSPYLREVIPDEYFLNHPQVGILTSRGCTYDCIFCQFSALNDHRVRLHSPERVLAELRWLHAKHQALGLVKEPLRVAFYDDALTLDQKRITEICQRIIDADLTAPEIRLWGETRPDRVSPDLLRLMRRAGLTAMNFGLESAVPRVLKVVRKASRDKRRPPEDLAAERRYIDQIRTATTWAREAGIEPTVSFMAGLPSETVADAQATCDFADSLPIATSTFNVLRVLDGTELASRSAEFGYTVRGPVGNRETLHSISIRSIRPPSSSVHWLKCRPMFSLMLRGWEILRYPRNVASYAPSVLILDDDQADVDAARRFVQRLAGCACNLLGPPDTIAEVLGLLSPLLSVRGFTGDGVAITRSRRLRCVSNPLIDLYCPTLTPFSKLHGHAAPDRDRLTVTAIRTNADLEAFERSLDELWRGESPGAVDLADCCRWFRPGTNESGSSCPAPLLTHIHLSRDGSIHPCASFPAVAHIDDDLRPHELARSTVATVERVSRSRGCSRCPIQQVCPKCPAPHPLDDEAYCAFQRREAEFSSGGEQPVHVKHANLLLELAIGQSLNRAPGIGSARTDRSPITDACNAYRGGMIDG